MEKENKNLELEDIERDLYLRTLLTGERLGPLTGKPSIDRPWLINYSNEEIASIIPKRRIYVSQTYSRLYNCIVVLSCFILCLCCDGTTTWVVVPFFVFMLGEYFKCFLLKNNRMFCISKPNSYICIN